LKSVSKSSIKPKTRRNAVKSSGIGVKRERFLKSSADPYIVFKDNEKLTSDVSFLKPIYKKYGRSVVLNVLGWFDPNGSMFVPRKFARKFIAINYSYKPFKDKVGV